MMLRFLLLIALAAVPVSARTAPATSPFFEAFKAICLNNRADLSRAPDVARTRGFGHMRAAVPAGMKSWTPMTGLIDDKPWLVALGTGDNSGQAFHACSVSGVESGIVGAEALARWVGLPGRSPSGQTTAWAFEENGGKRSALDLNDEARLKAALDAGGYFRLTIEMKGDKPNATLIRITWR
jgi:hypothetical protein